MTEESKNKRVLPWQTGGSQPAQKRNEKKKTKKVDEIVKIEKKLSSLGAALENQANRKGKNIILHHPITTQDFCENPSKISEPSPRKIHKTSK
ncbi:unnamed protein product [Blepharisma stoltei]|uniref:Uncharacterized protein n=1 Tax=Blepharisma stoltei TaxID=1481888 RepID=A0AAU9IT33_9CILI|nr:unnamed protein product [Blepharisma stoltei]